MPSVCRACLVGDVKMYFLQNNILEIYEKLTNIKLSESGPQAVCYICHSLLQRCYKFTEMAHYSEYMLQDLHDNGIEASHENILRLNPTIKPKLSASCTKYMDNNIEDSNTHVKEEFLSREDEPVNSEEKCAIVEIEFIKEEPVDAAEDSVAADIPTEYIYSTETSLCENTETNMENKEGSCDTYENCNSLASHTSIDDKNNQIAIANDKPSDLAVHETHIERPYACDICDKKFTQKHSLTSHMRTHTGVKPYACSVCDKKFSSKYSLLHHTIAHTGKKPYACDKCDKNFSSKSYLAYHESTHTGEDPYMCNVCDKIFSLKSNLAVHMRTHTGEKPYACNKCDQKFTQKHVLTVHMRTHSGEKPYSCVVCHKKISNKSHLTVHMRIHTGERPHACDICDKKFHRKCALTVHKRTHTGERPYDCEKCNKKFSHKSHLTVHMRIHTGEKPFSCNICDQKFTQKYALTVHMRHHTGEKLTTPYECVKCAKECP